MVGEGTLNLFGRKLLRTVANLVFKKEITHHRLTVPTSTSNAFCPNLRFFFFNLKVSLLVALYLMKFEINAVGFYIEASAHVHGFSVLCERLNLLVHGLIPGVDLY